jgi:hypothetical protein
MIHFRISAAVRQSEVLYVLVMPSLDFIQPYFPVHILFIFLFHSLFLCVTFVLFDDAAKGASHCSTLAKYM